MSRITQAEFARLAGVNRSTVHRWIANGRIEADAQGLIDPESAARMREATESPLPHHQARKAQFDEARAGDGMGQATSAQQSATTSTELISKEDANHRAKIAIMKEREWAAVQREIDARKAAGDLVDVSKVRDAWRSAFVLLRSSHEALPPRAAPALAVRRGDVAAIERDLADMIADLLNECAAAFERKLDGQA
jgi:DNA-binding XRE family transcriptional regulator